MTYQVLARKWRPQRFDTLVGQQHVVKALSHALSTGRLHHAYLFTGTRGVGKTTLSRILAKSFNCETGVTATPCGVCGACQSIDSGSFTDYIEMDAASNRGVEDMTALLDRAAYAPVSGRYKIYMIDEVHMLSNTAFNAMLKTLEEPPEYLKFILATTDPQKIPVTVLSRCLQFSLKPMTVLQISDYLAYVMKEEALNAEPIALNAIAKAAQGSMRDALSILDQAIAYGSGQVKTLEVQAMLGVADTSGIYSLMRQLAEHNLVQALSTVQSLLDSGVNPSAILSEIADIASRLAIIEHTRHYSPSNLVELNNDPALIELMGLFIPEYLQLIYGIAIKAQGDVAYAPNAYCSVAMPLLRMAVFSPKQPQPLGLQSTPQLQTTQQVNPILQQHIPDNHNQVLNPLSLNPTIQKKTLDYSFTSISDWPLIAQQLPLKGLPHSAARNSECVQLDGLNVYLSVQTQSLADPSIAQRIQDALRGLLGEPYIVIIKVGQSHQGLSIKQKDNKPNKPYDTPTTYSAIDNTLTKNTTHLIQQEQTIQPVQRTAAAYQKAQQEQAYHDAQTHFMEATLVKKLLQLTGQVIEGSIKVQ